MVIPCDWREILTDKKFHSSRYGSLYNYSAEAVCVYITHEIFGL